MDVAHDLGAGPEAGEALLRAFWGCCVDGAVAPAAEAVPELVVVDKVLEDDGVAVALEELNHVERGHAGDFWAVAAEPEVAGGGREQGVAVLCVEVVPAGLHLCCAQGAPAHGDVVQRNVGRGVVDAALVDEKLVAEDFEELVRLAALLHVALAHSAPPARSKAPPERGEQVEDAARVRQAVAVLPLPEVDVVVPDVVRRVPVPVQHHVPVPAVERPVVLLLERQEPRRVARQHPHVRHRLVLARVVDVQVLVLGPQLLPHTVLLLHHLLRYLPQLLQLHLPRCKRCLRLARCLLHFRFNFGFLFFRFSICVSFCVCLTLRFLFF